MGERSRDRVFGVHRRNEIVAMIEAHGVVRIGEIVREFEVSRKTALRDLDALDAEGRVDKVHGGAVAVVPTPPGLPDERPEQSSQDRSLTIGVLVPTRGHHNRAILRGVESVLQIRGVRLSVAVSGWAPGPGRDSELADLVGSGIDGLLVRPTPTPDSDVVREWVEHPPVPTVLIEEEPTPAEHAGVWSVATNDHRGMAAAMGHLLDLGHRRIALITDGDAPRSRELQRLWRARLLDAGVGEELPMINGATSDGWPLPDHTAIEEILDTLRAAQVTASVCHNDIPALAIADRARQLGWAIPGDLSIVAYEDRVSTRATTPLTTVVLPGYEVGRVAAQALLEQLEGPDRRPRQIRIQPDLVVRDSTGRP